MNGDGYADVIVGAPYYDNGQDDEGAAFVYLRLARPGLARHAGLDGRERPGRAPSSARRSARRAT